MGGGQKGERQGGAAHTSPKRKKKVRRGATKKITPLSFNRFPPSRAHHHTHTHTHRVRTMRRSRDGGATSPPSAALRVVALCAAAFVVGRWSAGGSAAGGDVVRACVCV